MFSLTNKIPSSKIAIVPTETYLTCFVDELFKMIRIRDNNDAFKNYFKARLPLIKNSTIIEAQNALNRYKLS